MPLILNGTTGVSGVDGSAGTPSYQGTDTNTGVFFPAADVIAFTTNGTEDARFDSSGNLCVGTTTAVGKTTISNSAIEQIALTLTHNNASARNWNFVSGVSGLAHEALELRSGTSKWITWNDSAGTGNYAAFYTANTERMRIDSSGNVGIGTSSPSARLHVAGIIQSESTGKVIQLQQSGEEGYINMTGTSSIIFRNGASFTERMRITSAGNVSIGTTVSGGKLTVWDGNINVNWGGGYLSSIDRGITILAGGYNDTTNKARIVHIGGVGDNNNRCGWTAYSIKTNTVNNGAEYYIRPVTWNGTAFVEQTSAGVYLTDNATSWTSASDERLKENLEPIANAVEKVKTIRAVTGKYKADTDGTSRAFLIAQDVQAVLPEAVTENSEGYLGLAYTETIPLLVAAIKEQQAMIEELKQEVAKLKGV